MHYGSADSWAPDSLLKNLDGQFYSLAFFTNTHAHIMNSWMWRQTLRLKWRVSILMSSALSVFFKRQNKSESSVLDLLESEGTLSELFWALNFRIQSALCHDVCHSSRWNSGSSAGSLQIKVSEVNTGCSFIFSCASWVFLLLLGSLSPSQISRLIGLQMI